ncbi:MAG TPA: alanine racemase [Chlamydiales bacterium]|nr:alanine racemase [Chlamydiales bacterium]
MQSCSIHPAWIEIDTFQFRKNLKAIRKMIGSCLLCLPIKANAYGHGALTMAKIAEEEKVDCLGVSCVKEGIRLRKAGIAIPIVVFGAIHEDQIVESAIFDLEISISSRYKAELVAKKYARLDRKCTVHIEVDTGMQRTGVRPDTLFSLIFLIKNAGCFEIKGLYSHLATADCPNDPTALRQIEIFGSLANELRGSGVICHLANSGGVAFYPDSYFDMVRPGLLSYGYAFDEKTEEIRPCLSLKAKVSYFKVVQKERGISYGHTYLTQDETRIATIPVGYGDGYRRSLSNLGSVLIRGKRFPIAGAICMDQFMVDIGKEEAYVGDEAVLIGKQGDEEITLWELARCSNTILHEMLVSFNERLEYFYR